MKRSSLKMFVIFLCCSFFFLLGNAQDTSSLIIEEFPSSWEGDWAGELQIFGKEGLKQSLPMQLLIHPLENSSDFSFTIIYGVDVEKGKRDYILKTIDASKGHYAIDEQNSIMMGAYLLGGKLVQRFEVMGNLLDTFIAKEGEHLVWEIFSGKLESTIVSGDSEYEGEDIPEVKSYPIGVYQKCVLSKF